MAVDDFMDKVAKDLLDAFSMPLKQLRNEGRDYERTLCTEACEWLQRMRPDYIASTEVVYGIGAATDAKADLRITERKGNRRAWIEVKPIWEGSTYPRYSKFFCGKPDKSPMHLAKSVILGDIDKMDLIPEPYINNRFAFLLSISHDTETLGSSPALPKPRTRLSRPQILHLVRKRFEYAAEEICELHKVNECESSWTASGRTFIHTFCFYYRYTGYEPEE